MNQVINISFNNTNITWELTHHHLLYLFESSMKAICRHHTLTGKFQNDFQIKQQPHHALSVINKNENFHRGTTV